MSQPLENPADPLGEVWVGDDDPIGVFDPEGICGAQAVGNTCLRGPHPPAWRHISACDDRVDYVWVDVSTLDLSDCVLTPDGFCCRRCGCDWRLDEDGHYGDCPTLAEAESREAS
jgi:hypothetical protein